MNDHLVEKTDAFGDVAVHVMPERYAGAALRATLPPESRMSAPRPLPLPTAPVVVPPHAGVPPILPQKKSSARWVLLGVILILLCIIIGFLLYPKQKTLAPITVPAVATTTPVATSTIETTSTASATSTFAFTGSFRNSQDTDADGLTDVEEQEIYHTDQNNLDTDRDTYLDGGEVFYLYNPNGFAPVTLNSSGVVHTIGGETIGFTAYAPVDWPVQVDAQSLVVRSPGDEEKFHYDIRSNPGNLPLLDWVRVQDIQTDISTLVPYTSRMGVAGYRTADNFTAYFPMESAVLVVTYDPGARRELQYRRTFDMTLQSVTILKHAITSQDIVGMIPGVASSTTSTLFSESSSTVPTTSTIASTSSIETTTTLRTTSSISTTSSLP